MSPGTDGQTIVRQAGVEDAVAIAAIYTQGIEDRLATRPWLHSAPAGL